MPVISIETQISDEISEQFVNDGSINDYLDMFARGLYSPDELRDLLVAARDYAKERAFRKVLGPCAPDDSFANEGTWESA